MDYKRERAPSRVTFRKEHLRIKYLLFVDTPTSNPLLFRKKLLCYARVTANDDQTSLTCFESASRNLEWKLLFVFDLIVLVRWIGTILQGLISVCHGSH